MDERTAEWTIVKRPEFLDGPFQDVLNEIMRNRGLARMPEPELAFEQYQTVHGVVDFIYFVGARDVLIVELETSLDGKIDFCIQQTTRYENVAGDFPGRDARMVVLYAEHITNRRNNVRINLMAHQRDWRVCTYNIDDLRVLHDNEVERLGRTVGYGISADRVISNRPYTLGAVNRFMLAFELDGNDTLTADRIRQLLPATKGTNRGQPASPTWFHMHADCAEDLGLIERVDRGNCHITETGREFLDSVLAGDTATNLRARVARIPLTPDQRRILVGELLKDDFTEMSATKTAILLLYRYVQLNRGERFPNQRNFRFQQGEIEILRSLIGTNYNQTSTGNVLTWARNYCQEIGLIDVIPVERQRHSRIALTQVGSRFFNTLELTQMVKREMLHIPQEIT